MKNGFLLKQTRAPIYKDKNEKALNLIKKCKIDFKGSLTSDFVPLLKAMGKTRVAMIGEASHGTHEFYKTRAEITKRLISERGFNLIAVEGDWADVYRINRYVCLKSEDKSAKEALGDFQRFPTWMWRNTVVEEFVEWLKGHNSTVSKREDMVHFYGLDLYSMFSSADKVIDYLQKVDEKAAAVAKERYGTLDSYRSQEFKYAEDVAMKVTPSRQKEVVSMLLHMLQKGNEYLEGPGWLIDGDELFFAQQNAKVVKDAEEYYRNTFSGGATTWNLRDKHMFETLDALLQYHEKKRGQTSRAVLWAHNSHVGDARATEYARETGE